ncbi:MAG: DUF3488 and transglutaminase-like domain-containing protein [Cryobacterium sp.]
MTLPTLRRSRPADSPAPPAGPPPAPSHSSVRRAGHSAGWTITLALLLLLLAGFSGLGPLLRGTSWWWVVGTATTVPLLAAALLHRVGLPRPLLPVGASAALLLSVTAFFGADTGLAGLLPTPATLDLFRSLAEAGLASIIEQAAPAVMEPGIAFLLFLGTGMLAVLMHLVAVTLHAPALAGVAALAAALIPGFVLDDTGSMVPLVLTATAYLWLLRVDVRQRRGLTRGGLPAGSGGASLLVGSVTVVSALALSFVVPTLTPVTGPETNSGTLFGGGVSPMVSLGQDLRRPDAQPALHYTSTSIRQPYFRLLTLDELVGDSWTVRVDGIDTDNTVDAIGRPAGLDDAVPTTPARTSVVIDNVSTRWLPSPARATAVDGLNGNWYWDNQTGAIASTNATTFGQTYTVTSLDLAPDADLMRGSGDDYPSSVRRNLSISANPPPIIEQTALVVTDTAATRYDAAVAIQDYLRGSDFSYDTEAPVEEGYDGGGIGVVGVFLDSKRGYCVHFAAAMASMARSIGIPSRVSLGYLPGTRSQDLEQGLGRYDVTTHDLHAWPELYFVGVGWVMFEPTPGRGIVPDYEAVGIPADSTADTEVAEPNATAPDTEAALRNEDAAQNTAAEQEPVAAPLLWPGLVLGVSALLLVPALLRSLRRRRRLRRVRRGRNAAETVWAELTDAMRDHGIVVRSTDTPREQAAVLSAELPASVADALQRLLTTLEVHRYAAPRPGMAAGGAGAGPDGTAGRLLLADDLGRVTRALHAGVRPRRRWRARLAPVSILPGLSERT